MALNRAHPSAKAADPAKLLLFNKRCVEHTQYRGCRSAANSH